MNKSKIPFARLELFTSEQQEKTAWDLIECDRFSTPHLHSSSSTRAPRHHGYPQDWASVVPRLIQNLSEEMSEKAELAVRINLLEIVVKQLKTRLRLLENTQTRIIPINTFAPEPYELLKPIMISVHPVNEEFEAGWHDANIHSAGENEEEAVSN